MDQPPQQTRRLRASTMGDKIVVLNGGRVEQSGERLDLYDRPENKCVATFPGSPAMNLIEGKIDGTDGARLVLPGGPSALIGPTPLEWSGRQVTFGIRPENIRLNSSADLPCVVSLVEPTGSETHIVAHAGQTEIVAVLKERMRIRERETTNPGFDVARAHFFDPDSGRRLAIRYGGSVQVTF
jgi:multiple sugar transport system ATP-binding protein